MRVDRKYKLTPKDQSRFSLLAIREATQVATPKEMEELDRLSRRARRLLWQHPKMQEVKRIARNRIRQTTRKFEKLRKLVEKYQVQGAKD
jgi:hypothetical protein